MRQLLLRALCVASFMVGAAQAQPIYGVSVQSSSLMPYPLLAHEYGTVPENKPRRRHVSTSYRRYGDALAALGFSDLAQEHLPYNCRSSYQAQMLIRRAQEFSTEHPYVRALAENQTMVMKTCRNYADAHDDQKPPWPQQNWPILPSENKTISLIARQDFDYLTANAHFYANNLEEAAQRYSEIAADNMSAHQDAARLMHVRVLRKLKQHEEAYQHVLRYKQLSQGWFTVWLDQQEDLIARFAGIHDYRAAHLEKVYKRVFRKPIDGEPVGFRAYQAVRDLESHFLFGHQPRRGMPADWWLQDTPPARADAFYAVWAMSRKHDAIDWIQTYHTSWAWRRDNSWFAGPDLAIDDAYRRITRHAYTKWQDEGLMHWAPLVAARIGPDSPYVEELAALVDAVHGQSSVPAAGMQERFAYPHVLEHVVRLRAQQGNYAEAVRLIKQAYQQRRTGRHGWTPPGTTALIKLLMIRGEMDHLRTLNTGIDWSSRGLSFLPLWLAEDDVDVVSLAGTRLAELPNVLGDETLYRLLTMETTARGRAQPVLHRDLRASYARILWMRGFVFKDDELMTKAEPLMRRYHHEFEPFFTQADNKSNAERRRIFTHMILVHPNLRPYAYHKDIGVNVAARNFRSLEPMEGNWWCRAEDRARHFDGEDMLAQRFFYDFFSTPGRHRQEHRPRYWTHHEWARKIRNARRTDAVNEREMVTAAWQRFRKDYPFFHLVSNDAQAQLASLPRATDYLWTELNTWTTRPAGYLDWLLQRDPRIPEALHRLVWGTRYACGSGDRAVSYAAWRRLQRRYGNTGWAQRTPYWYD